MTTMTTKLNHRDRAVSAIRDAYSCARSFRWTLVRLLARKEEIYATITHCPEWVRQFTRGYDQCLFDRLYMDDLEFCYLVDGVLYSTWGESSHRKTEEFYKANKGHILSNTPGNHYWRGSDKPFS